MRRRQFQPVGNKYFLDNPGPPLGGGLLAYGLLTGTHIVCAQSVVHTIQTKMVPPSRAENFKNVKHERLARMLKNKNNKKEAEMG